MKRNKRMLILVSAAAVSTILVGSMVVFGPPIIKGESVEATTTRTMTFDSSHTSFTTSAGNKFSSYWIKRVGGSALGSGGLVYLEGTAVWSSYSESYSISESCLGIKGNYNISNVSKLEIAYQISTDWTDLDLYTLKADGSLGGKWSIGSTGTSYGAESTKTITINTPTSYYGFAFKIGHPSDSGGANDKMKATIKSLKITYSCSTAAEQQRQAEIDKGIIPYVDNNAKTVSYGLYPQTRVSNSSLISALNLIETPESNGWYLYNDTYYAKVSAQPCDSSRAFDDGTTIVSGTTYWFKCQPIIWKILQKNSNEYLLLSSKLLDAHCYYNSSSTRVIEGETIYPNNYEHSDIRTWLNGDFLASAFALNDAYIQTTVVDNSASTTSASPNEYACGNTNDEIFLPSYRDYLNTDYGFTNTTEKTATRYAVTTDWARARGTYYYISSGAAAFTGYCCTRSPMATDSERVWGVYDVGNIFDVSVTYEGRGVRPAVTLHLS